VDRQFDRKIAIEAFGSNLDLGDQAARGQLRMSAAPPSVTRSGLLLGSTAGAPRALGWCLQ
jgi:hypothetical protein